MTRDGIDLTDGTRALLDYVLNHGAEEYIHSALLGYTLLVHEFGKGIKVQFTMNFYDRSTPMIKLLLDSFPDGNLPDDTMDRIDKIRNTLRSSMSHAGAKITLVTI